MMLGVLLFFLLTISSSILIQKFINSRIKVEIPLFFGVFFYIGVLSFVISITSFFADVRFIFPVITLLSFISIPVLLYIDPVSGNSLKALKRFKEIFRNRYLFLVFLFLVISLLHNTFFDYGGFDGENYHTPFSFEILKTGRYDITFSERNSQDFLYPYKVSLPSAFESFTAYAMSFDERIYKIFPTFEYFILIVTTFYLIRLFADKRKSMFGVFALAVTPVIVYHSIMSYVDLISISFVIAGIYYYQLFCKERKMGLIVLSSFMLGFAGVVKNLSLIYILSFPVLFLIDRDLKLKKRVKLIFIFSIISLGILSVHSFAKFTAMGPEGMDITSYFNKDANANLLTTVRGVLSSTFSIGTSADVTPFFYLGILALLILSTKKLSNIGRFSIISFFVFILLLSYLQISEFVISVIVVRTFYILVSALSVPFFIVYFYSSKTFRRVSVAVLVLFVVYSLFIFYARSDLNGNINTVIHDFKDVIYPVGNTTKILLKSSTIRPGVVYTKYPSERFVIGDDIGQPDFIVLENNATKPNDCESIYDKTIEINLPREERRITIYRCIF